MKYSYCLVYDGPVGDENNHIRYVIYSEKNGFGTLPYKYIYFEDNGRVYQERFVDKRTLGCESIMGWKMGWKRINMEKN